MLAPGTLTPHPHQDQFHIVLVEPADSLNIGSVCRAMKNLGFSNLHLVKPQNLIMEKARATACWGADLLEKMTIHHSFEEAIKDAEDVVGLSTREGRNRSARMVLGEWLEKEIITPPKRTAILFGPEDNGLRAEHIDHCRCIVRIPSTEACPAFNLAQSAMIVMYELSKRTMAESIALPERELPDWNMFYQLDRVVENVLTISRYYREGTPEPIPGLIKQLFRRMNPDDREMRVLLGMFGRIERQLSWDEEQSKE